MIRELKSDEFFDSRYGYIFDDIEKRAKTTKFNPGWFFPHWRHLMSLGIARTWTGDDCLIGVIFANNTFSGEPTALVTFWFSTEVGRRSGDAGKLLTVAEYAAMLAGCKSISSAAYAVLNGVNMGRKYRLSGYSELETTYRKEFVVNFSNEKVGGL